MVLTIGIIGLTILGIAWIPQIIKIQKNKYSQIDWRFGTLYVIGSLLLAIYAFQIKDYIFLILNSFIAIMSSISLFFSVRKKLK